MITLDQTILNELLKTVISCVSIGFLITFVPSIVGYVITSLLSLLERV